MYTGFFFKSKGKVPEVFLGAVGFSLHMDRRYIILPKTLTKAMIVP
jgi:hypothetical protein